MQRPLNVPASGSHDLSVQQRIVPCGGHGLECLGPARPGSLDGADDEPVLSDNKFDLARQSCLLDKRFGDPDPPGIPDLHYACLHANPPNARECLHCIHVIRVCQSADGIMLDAQASQGGLALKPTKR